MCGRIDFHNSVDFIEDMKKYYYDIEDHISYEENLPETTKQLYNIFPTSPIVTLITGEPKKLLKARWGLLPHWAKDISFNAPINARAETIESKPSFKMPFRKQRCIIPINGFYEWKVIEKGKVPYYIKPKEDEYFMLAGIWDVWSPKTSLFGDDEILSTAIITTHANELMQDIHERMPVILDEEAQRIWLDSDIEDITLLKSLLKPYESEKMIAYEVDKKVNSPAYSNNDCIIPINDIEF